MPPAIMEPPAEPVSPQIKTMFARRGLKDMTESQSRTMTSHYYAKAAFDDYAISIALQTVREKGLMDNTWIVYTSDHGEMLGDHRFSQKSVFYKGALSIPLIARPPGGTEPWIAHGLTGHYDIATTSLGAADAAHLEADHGVSLLPKIEAGGHSRDAQKGKNVIFSEVNLYGTCQRL